MDEVGIEVPLEAEAEEAADEVLAHAESVIMRTGSSFVPIKHDGVIYIRPPLELVARTGRTTLPSSRKPKSGLCAIFQDVAVRVAEDTRVAAVERFRRLSGNLRAVSPGELDHLVHRVARADVVRQRDATPAGGLVADAHVGDELLATPEDEHDAVRLEERGFSSASQVRHQPSAS